MARPTDYTEDLVREAWSYAYGGWEKEGHPFPSVVGLCKVINRSRSIIYKWAQDPNKEFLDILSHINENQELVAWEKGLTNTYNASLVKLLLGKHGYHDKQDNTHSGPDGQPIKTESTWTVLPVKSNASNSDS